MVQEDNEQQHEDPLFNSKDLLEIFSIPSGAIRRLNKDKHLKSFARNVYRDSEFRACLAYLRTHPDYAIKLGFRLSVVSLIHIEGGSLDKENGLVEKLETLRTEEVRINGYEEYKRRLEDY